jgi:diguanylate cyclase (GGDEF)-like protein
MPDSTLLDEAFLACTSSHCVFNADGVLINWSESFASLYPTLSDIVTVGLSYRDWLRTLYKRAGIRNLREVDDVEAWVDRQLAFIGHEDVQFIHHLIDDRYVLIRHTELSNGNWLFAAFDITELQQMRKANARSEYKFQQFARLASDWFWELDENLCYRYHSKHTVPMGGIEVSKLVGKERVRDIRSRLLNNQQLQEHIAALTEKKPFDVVLTCIAPDGQVCHARTVGTPQFDRHGKFTGFLGCGHDVTEAYALKQQFEYQATHDELTGLWNRRAFAAELNKLLEAVGSTTTTPMSLMFIDLDRFKLVNDSAGHQAGDQLLCELSDLFAKVLGDETMIARLGGDEFGAVVSQDVEAAMTLALTLISTIGEHQYYWGKRNYTVGASVGVVAIDHLSRDSSELLSKADIACYSAKKSGRNQAQQYTTQSSFQAQQNDELGKIKLLNDAINDNQVSLFLQPIVPAGNASETRVKFEVLMRFRDRSGQMLSSADIIPIAEKYERMQQLDLWVTEQSLHTIAELEKLNVCASLSVNLSGNTLSSAHALSQIVALVKSHGIAPRSLCFEVTETTAIANIDQVLTAMSELRALGCEFSLDDFGSGLSSFGYLKSLPVEYLKIDGSFVRNIMQDRACRAIVTAFNTLSHEMGMKTVAEFVENQEIADVLISLDIDYLQGFSVGMPRDVDDWLTYYREEQRRTGT